MNKIFETERLYLRELRQGDFDAEVQEWHDSGGHMDEAFSECRYAAHSLCRSPRPVYAAPQSMRFPLHSPFVVLE